jgi:predicted HicB family RNase H-like nuclease
MSDSKNRRVSAYPNHVTHKQITEQAEKQGISKSQVVNSALKEYFKKTK